MAEWSLRDGIRDLQLNIGITLDKMQFLGRRRQVVVQSGGENIRPCQSIEGEAVYITRLQSTSHTKKSDTQPGIRYFLCLVGLEEGGLAESKVKKCPVDIFLAQRKVAP